MLELKHGDTDGVVTFSFETDAGAVIDITGRTVDVTFYHPTLGINRVIALTPVEPPTLGQATWQPTDADYVVLIGHETPYRVEGITTNEDNERERAIPTLGYDQVKIWPRLPVPAGS